MFDITYLRYIRYIRHISLCFAFFLKTYYSTVLLLATHAKVHFKLTQFSSV